MEKIRKITSERDSYKEKCQELEKTKKTEKSSNSPTTPLVLGRSSISDLRSSQVGKTVSEHQFKKTQGDLRRAEAEIEKLNGQLDKAYRSNGGTNVVVRPRGKDNTGAGNFIGTSRMSIKNSKSPTSLSPRQGGKASEENVEGVNFSFGGKSMD